MKYLILCLLFSFHGLGQITEHAVFRVDNTTFFLSDVKRQAQIVAAYRCLVPESSLLQSLDLSSTHEENFENMKKAFDEKNTELSEMATFFYKMIRLVKLELFINQQQISFTMPKPPAQTKCLAQSEWQHDELKTLYRADAFFTQRFGESVVVMSEQEISEIKKKNPKLDEKELKALIGTTKRKKSQESIALFLLTLDKKFQENVFF